MIAKLIVVCMAVSIHAEDSSLRPGLSPGAYRGAGYADPVYPSVPFSFGYDTVNEYGTKLFHKEDSDASNSRTGSYGYTDANGLYRRVNYVADAGGFRATVETNEPGTAAGQSADVVFNASPVVSGTGAVGVQPYRTATTPAYGYGGKYGYAKDPARLGNEAAKYGPAGYGPAGYGSAGYGSAGYGPAGYGPAGYGPEGYGPQGPGPAGYGPAGYGSAGYRAAGYDRPGYGPAGYSPAEYGPAGYGPAGYKAAGYGRPGYGLPAGHHGYGHHGQAAKS